MQDDFVAVHLSKCHSSTCGVRLLAVVGSLFCEGRVLLLLFTIMVVGSCSVDVLAASVHERDVCVVIM